MDSNIKDQGMTFYIFHAQIVLLKLIRIVRSLTAGGKNIVISFCMSFSIGPHLACVLSLSCRLHDITWEHNALIVGPPWSLCCSLLPVVIMSFSEEA